MKPSRGVENSVGHDDLPEGREDDGAVVEDDPEPAEAARDDGVLLEPFDDGRGRAAGRALEAQARAVREDGGVGRLRQPERRARRGRRRRQGCNEGVDELARENF